jgi:hypothetical protein
MLRNATKQSVLPRLREPNRLMGNERLRVAVSQSAVERIQELGQQGRELLTVPPTPADFGQGSWAHGASL